MHSATAVGVNTQGRILQALDGATLSLAELLRAVEHENIGDAAVKVAVWELIEAGRVELTRHRKLRSLASRQAAA